MTLRFGLMTLQLPPYAKLAERWRRAEALGWDSLWIGDHTSAQFPGLIVYEAYTLLGAMACETSRVRIGALVTPIAFRNPTMLAMSAITVDHLSGGRLEVGIGAGGGDKDAAALGMDLWSPAERLERFAEQLAILDRALRGEQVDYAGTYYRAAVTVVVPIQVPRPPLMIAAQGRRTMQLVAQYADAWNTGGGQPIWTGRVSAAEALASVRRQLEQLDAACAAIGRDPKEIRRSLLANRVDPPLFSSVDRFTEYIGLHREIGIQEFIAYWPIDPATLAERERVLERVSLDVLPKLRA
jgi:alkanesulfonate monooxygenase SsuD/methylene tetrahydromethanopterin reductase-like flavin-dependent oxidoreductase (luciferase family)